MANTLMHGQAPGGGGPRGKVVGWTHGAALRNAHWLQNADWPAVDRRGGDGLVFTGTVRKMPTAGEWRARMRRLVRWATRTGGVDLMHWCVEFQRRGAPHVHAAMFGKSLDADAVVAAWLRLNPGAEAVGQHCEAIRDGRAWVVYVSKHAQRGVAHYQRNRAALEAAGRMDDSWLTDSAGRMWGVRGDWPTVPELTLERVGGPEFEEMSRRWGRLAGVATPMYFGIGAHGRPQGVLRGVILRGDRGDVRADTLEYKAVELGVRSGPGHEPGRGSGEEPAPAGHPLYHQAYWDLTSGDGSAGLVTHPADMLSWFWEIE